MLCKYTFQIDLFFALSGECDLKFRFPSPVLKVQFHPRNEKEILVSPMRHAAVVVTLTDSQPPQSEEGSAEKQSESSPGKRTHVDWCDA